jgi:hypothetical protein
MRTSHHGRRPLTRLTLAAGAVAVVVALAEAAHVLAALIGGPRGVLAGVFFLGGVSACGFALEHRSRRVPALPRPVARIPEPESAAHEAVKSAA